MEKENQNTFGITAADVINSDEWKQTAESVLCPIRKSIDNAQKNLKAGERLRRTEAIKLNEFGLLELQPFTDAYACIVAHTEIPLPSSLRKAIKEQGDNIFLVAYNKIVATMKTHGKDERKQDHDPYIEE